jgi:hypothetical protein
MLSVKFGKALTCAQEYCGTAFGDYQQHNKFHNFAIFQDIISMEAKINLTVIKIYNTLIIIRRQHYD